MVQRLNHHVPLTARSLRISYGNGADSFLRTGGLAIR